MLKELKKFFLIWKYNLKAESALKQSFLLLVFGMVLNDIAFVAVWIAFFQSFGSFNGWQTADVVGLQAMMAAGYGTGFIIAGGARQLPRMVDSGYFDNLLLTPGNLHLKIFASAIRPSALGDIVFGVILSIIYFLLVPVTWYQMLLWFITFIPVGLIIANFTLFSSLISFWVNDAMTLAAAVQEVLIGPSLYPSSVYNTSLRIFFTYIVPAIVIGGMPVEAIRQNNSLLFLFVAATAVFWTAFTNLALNFAVKKYQSANLVANRV